MGVLKYFNKAKNFVADVKEYNRLIKREQLPTMLDRSKLVLRHDFDECFKVEGTVKGRFTTIFSRLLDENHGMAAWKILLTRSQPHFVPIGLVEKKSRDRFLEFVESMDETVEVGNEDLVLDKTHMQALNLGALLDGWNAVHGEGIFFKRAAQISLISGEGDVALSFWKAVNDLKDYSALFPDHKPPPGPKEKDKQETKAPSWKPVFVPQGGI